MNNAFGLAALDGRLAVLSLLQSTDELDLATLTWYPSETPLVRAARAGQLCAVRMLLEGKAMPVEKKQLRKAPEAATTNCHTDVVCALLDAGAVAETAAEAAVVEYSSHFLPSAEKTAKHLAAVRLLLGSGSPLTGPSWSSTLLHAAAAAGNVAVVTMLCELGFDPLAVDAGGATPLRRTFQYHETSYSEARSVADDDIRTALRRAAADNDEAARARRFAGATAALAAEAAAARAAARAAHAEPFAAAVAAATAEADAATSAAEAREARLAPLTRWLRAATGVDARLRPLLTKAGVNTPWQLVARTDAELREITGLTDPEVTRLRSFEPPGVASSWSHCEVGAWLRWRGFAPAFAEPLRVLDGAGMAGLTDKELKQLAPDAPSVLRTALLAAVAAAEKDGA